MIDDLDGLLGEISSNIFWRNCGMSRLLDPTTGAVVALFPITATDPEEWSARAVAMHEAQVPIALPAKPLNTGGLRPRGSAVAVFERATPTPDEVPKFHESPGSTTYRTERGN